MWGFQRSTEHYLVFRDLGLKKSRIVIGLSLDFGSLLHLVGLDFVFVNLIRLGYFDLSWTFVLEKSWSVFIYLTLGPFVL